MLNYLIEIRTRLIRTLAVFAAAFCVFFCYPEPVLAWIFAPLHAALGADNTLIATRVTAPVFTPIVVATQAAMLLTAPFALWQIWRFVMPGLYGRERRLLRKILTGSILLFIAGILFCHYGVLPFFFHLAASSLPAGIRLMPDLTDSLSFITTMQLLFGISFQVPLVCLAIVRFGLCSVERLESFRPCAIVSAFVVGMILTPPDVLSQVLLAVPLCVLYEAGILLARQEKTPSSLQDACR